MSNGYFRFKQFTIYQDRCAMKVTTDACIQGAWTPVFPRVKRVLDIGTGTGLLSLMLAQRNPDVIIDAIEYDAIAAEQARENVAGSPWYDRINIIHGDVRNYLFPGKYDLIISNPPFFNNSLLSDKSAKNNARHTVSLSYEDLLKVVSANLDDNGYTSILLPHPEYLLWCHLLRESDYKETARLSVKHTSNAPVKRVVSINTKKAMSMEPADLIIMNDEDQYSREFTALMSPFYLAL